MPLPVYVFYCFGGLFFVSLCVGSAAATLLISLKKWRIDELYQVHRERFSKRLPREFCFFCVGFWLCVGLTFGLYLVLANSFYIVVPFIAAPICKIIYEKSRST